jgi:hypothetical protein
VTLSEEEVSVSAKEQYYTLQVQGDLDGATLLCSSDASWLTFDADTIPNDGYFDFYVAADKAQEERTGTITVLVKSLALDDRTLTCRVVQCHDTGENASDMDVTATHRVGYGYDIFGLYQSDVSVKASILNPVKLVQDASGLVTTSEYQTLNMETKYARTLSEMATLLTTSQEKTKSGLRGGSKTVSKFSQNGSYNSDDEQFVHISYTATHRLKALDMGVLDKMIDEDESGIFDSTFRNLRLQIIAKPTNTKLIDSLLNTYGTHLVVSAELGGSIEVSANFSMNLTGSLAMRAEDFSEYFFHNQTSEFLLSNGAIRDMTSTIKTSTNCIISGGSSAAVTDLENDINKSGKVNPDKLLEWLSSLDKDENLVPMHFQLVPIWYLFPTACAPDIIKAVNQRAERTQNTSYLVGTDYYQVKIDDSWLQFGDGSSDTQVKVVYASGTSSGAMNPILEICNEYVPHIRGDKRIPVIYGIRNGRPFLGAGLYPGDGDANPPAWLTFSDSEVYVDPVEDADIDDQIKTLYYLHGNIYEQNYGIIVSSPKRTQVKSQYLTLISETQYPIVKIGSGYWTRCDIPERLHFAQKYGMERENVIDGVYYANIFYQNQDGVTASTQNHYGAAVDETTKERTQWYLPKQRDVNNLHAYVELNPKALIKQQVSGFEAEFNGMYGPYDDVTGQNLWVYEVRYKDAYCFIACKDEETSQSGTALLLSTDYKLSQSRIQMSADNEYPIRLFRTAYWKYEDIK